jgi:FHA domain
MSADQSRRNLLIDIFDLVGQQARALPELTPPTLVGAILEEFRELEFLGDNPKDYELLKADSRASLDEAISIGQQLADGERLVLVERQALLPKGTRRTTKQIYLREQGGGKVYKLHWYPAIIGRPDKSQEHADWVAVNLATHAAGSRISRRHAQITESGGQYFVERLSQNPMAIRDGHGTTTPVEGQKLPLRHGDLLYFDYSQITLKFIVREEGPAA